MTQRYVKDVLESAREYAKKADDEKSPQCLNVAVHYLITVAAEQQKQITALQHDLSEIAALRMDVQNLQRQVTALQAAVPSGALEGE